MLKVEVLKFGSSVLRSPADLPIAVDEIYRRWRSGSRVIAVVSAFAGVTDTLLPEASVALQSASPEATAAYVATGGQHTAALLLGTLRQHGLPARLLSPREISLIAAGTPLDSAPVHADRGALERLLDAYPILVLPGYYGVDHEGRKCLFGRGGSDLTALFLAGVLGAQCRDAHDEWAPPPPPQRPLRLALLGCGVVGRGVYEAAQRYPDTFDIRHVVVRQPERHPDIPTLTTAPTVAIDPDIDVVVLCIGGTVPACALLLAALRAGKAVVTANKAAVAALGATLRTYTTGAQRQLWYSAAVGGALPALETLALLEEPVRAIRGIVNGTCGAVLDAWSSGCSRAEAIRQAQAAGYAEADPQQDLSGRDSVDKLALLIQAAFREWIHPKNIPTLGIDHLSDPPQSCHLIARAARTHHGITARVAPERIPSDSFLGSAKGPENRLEIELASGAILRLRAQGAGRWPTTISVMGDLHEIARQRAAAGASARVSQSTPREAGAR